MQAKAFLFDLNGTMIDDMHYHISAWHKILNDLGANITYEESKANCYGKSAELIGRILPGKFTDEEAYQIGFDKEATYREMFRPHLKLMPGLDQFLEQAYQAGIQMAIGSAGIMPNLTFVTEGLQIGHYFQTLVSADDVVNSKPDPETYLICAERLGVKPSECIVFEDALKGVESAERAGMPCVVITSIHEAAEFAGFNNIIRFIKDYKGLDPKQLS